jgi:hypothetical protein
MDTFSRYPSSVYVKLMPMAKANILVLFYSRDGSVEALAVYCATIGTVIGADGAMVGLLMTTICGLPGAAISLGRKSVGVTSVV